MGLRKKVKRSYKSGKTVEGAESSHELIFKNRERARSLAHKILRKWNVHLERDEIESTVDLALCKAANGYSNKEGAKFITYFYYFLKGCLVQTISHNMKFNSEINNSDMGCAEGNRDFIEEAAEPQPSDVLNSCPEYRTYKKELNGMFSDALVELSDLERTVVLKVHVCEIKMAHVAKELGYSRGYLTEVRGKALRKMRKSLVGLEAAA